MRLLFAVWAHLCGRGDAAVRRAAIGFVQQLRMFAPQLVPPELSLRLARGAMLGHAPGACAPCARHFVAFSSCACVRVSVYFVS